MSSQPETPGEVQEARARQMSPTNAPITEEERQVTRERDEALRRPFPWLVMGTALTVVALAVVAGALAGWRYAIPFVVLGGVIAVFLGTHRVLGRAQTERYGGRRGEAREEASDDASDPVPHLGFDEKSQLGSTGQLSDEDQQAHADMDQSTGQR